MAGRSRPAEEAGDFWFFLGYAPGVGKTYNMLSEGIRRKARGEDVVIGLLETHGRKGVAELAGKMETVPRRQMDYKGASFDEMDVDAILHANRKWCWSTNWLIPTSKAVSTPNAIRM